VANIKSSKPHTNRTVIRPIVTYTSETWVLKENVIQKLLVFGRKILRGIFEPTKKKIKLGGLKTKKKWTD
jgi:hypothetical protein